MRMSLIEFLSTSTGLTVYMTEDPQLPEFVCIGEPFDCDFPPLRKDLVAHRDALQEQQRLLIASQQVQADALAAQISAIQEEIDSPPIVG